MKIFENFVEIEKYENLGSDEFVSGLASVAAFGIVSVPSGALNRSVSRRRQFAARDFLAVRNVSVPLPVGVAFERVLAAHFPSQLAAKRAGGAVNVSLGTLHA